MNLLSMAHFSASLIFMMLIVLIIRKNPKAPLNLVCALLSASLCIWNFAFAFIQSSAVKTDVRFWMNIASIGWCSFAGFSIWFSFVFTEKKWILGRWYFYILLSIFPVIFMYRQWTGNFFSDFVRHSYGWGTEWSMSLWTWLFFVYYIGLMIVSILAYFRYYRKTRIVYKKKQALIILTADSIVLAAGTVTDTILPSLKIGIIPPIASIFALFWMIGIMYAITRYKFMTISSGNAASDILSTMNDLLLLIDPEGGIIEINKSALDLLGFKRDELAGKQIDKLLMNENPQVKQEIIRKAIEQNGLRDYRVSFRSGNGEPFPVSLSCTLLKDRYGVFSGIVCAAKDLHETLLLQETEREFNLEKEWTKKLTAQSVELREAYDKLRITQAQLIQSEKMSAVGLLAGGIAHEINNPLGVILGFAQSITERMDKNDQLYNPIQSIERAAMRCKKLVEDLLTFSRTEKTYTEAVDLNGTIEETLSLVQTQASMQMIEIKPEYDFCLKPVMANKNQIQQVIINICNNAIDAISGKGEIRIITRQAEDHAELIISDTGCGISDDVKKRIFEPFFTTKEVGKGTGLGLSLCYEIIEKHNGTITVESGIGKGASFIIRLPLHINTSPLQKGNIWR